MGGDAPSKGPRRSRREWLGGADFAFSSRIPGCRGYDRVNPPREFALRRVAVVSSIDLWRGRKSGAGARLRGRSALDRTFPARRRRKAEIQIAFADLVEDFDV